MVIVHTSSRRILTSYLYRFISYSYTVVGYMTTLTNSVPMRVIDSKMLTGG